MLSKKFVAVGVVFLAVIARSEAMESDVTSVKETLKIQKGDSFAMVGVDLAKKYQDHFDTLNLKKVDEDYKLAAEHHKIDLDIYRGEKFEPRPFWKLPPREILGILAPALEECKVWEMVQYRYQNMSLCFCGGSQYPTDPYPEDMERILRKSVFKLIKEYLKSKGLLAPSLKTLFMEQEYNTSLMYYRNKNQELDETDKLLVKCGKRAIPNIRTIPLTQYFEPYFIPQYTFWHSCDGKLFS